MALAASTNFVEPATSPEAVGDVPVSVAAADLDGDTDHDLAVANQIAGDVTILRNNGSGNFVAPATSPEAAGGFPSSVAAADLDGDLDQDLAIANAATGNVTILRNNGTADFSQPASSPEGAGTTPTSVAAADLDGDADRDLAVSNQGTDNVTILKNTGSGNFNQPASSPEAAGDGPHSVAAVDLDGDLDQDLAVANAFSFNVTILRNNGSGNFVAPATSPEAGDPGPRSVAAADFDLDGDRDLAVANSTGNVTILRNLGSGNFVKPATSPEATGQNSFSVAAADLDADTDQDLAVANAFSNNVTILRNR